MRKNSIKNTRINEEVKKALSVIIRDEIKDPRVAPMTTVTRVMVAPDLKTAKIYISVLGTHEEAEETMQGLRSAGGFIRKQLASSVNLRNTPELHFLKDDSIEYAIHISSLIDQMNQQDGGRAHADDSSEEEDILT